MPFSLPKFDTDFPRNLNCCNLIFLQSFICVGLILPEINWGAKLTWDKRTDTIKTKANLALTLIKYYPKLPKIQNRAARIVTHSPYDA